MNKFKSKNENKIINTIRQWAAEAVSLVPDIRHLDNTVADYYQLLHTLTDICVKKISSGSISEIESVQKITKVVNLLYQGGNQYTRNAIENKFLTVLSFVESPGNFKKHLELFPTELRKGYIKTILES